MTCKHELWSFDRTICACGWMHYYCDACGQVDNCELANTKPIDKMALERASLEEVADAFINAVEEGVFENYDSLRHAVYELCDKAVSTGWNLPKDLPKICEVCEKVITVEPNSNSAGSHDPAPHVVKSYSDLGPKRGLNRLDIDKWVDDLADEEAREFIGGLND